MTRLDTLISPASVMVIGSTDREGAVGRSILTNLDTTFEGEIIPVNPNRDRVLGHRCYASVASAPRADVAVVVLPAELVVDVVKEVGEADITNVVVISAGFSETGSDGTEREQELISVARDYDLNLVGPNCLGVMNTTSGLNASFGTAFPDPGPISFVSQSGAFITAVLDWAADAALGFSNVVSLGNEAVLDQTDFIQSWGKDPKTNVIIGYLEAIDNGREFIDVCREVTQETPIVLVKSGRTEAGARAASSHTGSIAGNEEAYTAGISQAGVIRTETVQDLFDAARALALLPPLEQETVAVVTNAGGPGVMATDALGASLLGLAGLSDETRERLIDSLPTGASAYNPIDILGDAPADRFGATLETVLSDGAVGAAIVVAAPTDVLSFDELAEHLVEISEECTQPIVTCLMGGQSTADATETLRTAGIPSFFDPARAVQSLNILARHREISQRGYDTPREFSNIDPSSARDVLRSTVDRGDNLVGVEAMDVLTAYGIDIPAGEVITSPGAADEVAATLGDTVAMKIVSPDISHKSDIGGVAIGVNPEEAGHTYEQLIARARSYQSDATIIGVQVQEMVDLTDATETIVGCIRDPQFGPMLLFGLGGIFVEALEDTTVRIAPISQSEGYEMINDIQAAPLLRGARGRPAADLEAVVETLERLSQLVMDFPSILELDINPLVVGPDGATAIDLRATIDPEQL